MTRPDDPAVAAAEGGQSSDRRPRPNDGNANLLPPATGPPSAFEPERIITLAEAAQLTGLSEDSLRRHYASLFRRLSPRRIGMKLRDAPTIGNVFESRSRRRNPVSLFKSGTH